MLGLGCGLFGLAVSFFVGDRILAITYSPEYALYGSILTLLMLPWTLRFVSAFLTNAIVATRRFKMVPGLYLPAVLVSLVAGGLLIPSHGLIGAAWATTLSALAQFCVTGFRGRFLFHRRVAR